MQVEETMKIGSLFSGIGGIELGLERAGLGTPIWFVENNPYCQEVLKKHWNGVPIYGDIRTIDWNNVERPDVLTGGFPCQDVSNAGRRAGITGSRSGLWKEYLRAIRALRPKYCVIENVRALLNRGLDTVLCDLASIRYDAFWTIISAASIGAWHLRERIFIIAWPSIPDSDGSGCNKSSGFCQIISNANTGRLRKLELLRQAFDRNRKEIWAVEPGMGRLVDGVSTRMDNYIWKCQIEALGNAVVPQCAEVIGKIIKDQEQRRFHSDEKSPETQNGQHSEGCKLKK